jgi:DUF4097 and DUF4098 domain-containing protein YvlB
MNEERKRILNMVQEGKITAEEADKLLEKLEAPDMNISESKDNALPKYLYVKVDPKDGASTEHGRVRVRVPLSLVKAGMNIASLMPKDVHDKIDHAMHEKGMKFDLSELKPENIDQLMLALKELQVDVDSDKETVKVYCE